MAFFIQGCGVQALLADVSVFWLSELCPGLGRIFIWEVPQIRGPNIDPQVVGLYYKDYQNGAPNCWKLPYQDNQQALRSHWMLQEKIHL